MSTSRRRDRMRQGFGLLTALTLVIGGLTAAFALTPDLAADAVELPSPPPLLQRDDNVVTADPIPTVQIDNGYVWAQATIGSTVYAVGDFDNARAPLAVPGTQLTARSNVLAYDINTGDLLSFAPQVNGVIKAVAASPDGSRIYIGGSFSSVNGQARYGIAALDPVTGELIAGFKPSVGGSGVYALVATGSMVYTGGLFTQANGTPRTNAAAFNAGNGALMPWAPQSDRQIDAMVADPGGQKMILGGRFASVNGNTTMRGTAAVDVQTGAVDVNWALPQTVKNGSNSGGNAGKAGIFALAADDTGVYGTGWVFADLATGNLEGTFAAEAGSGDVRWIADCLGDHYGVYSTGETVYTTSHTHACSTMGLHPEQSTRQYRYAEAYTTEARGLLGRNPHAGGTYQNWEGTPGPSAYAWYPDFLVGTTSGLGQAGLSITGVGDTISIAGEFVSVNNGRFEGIVRFAKNPPGGAQSGPRLSGSAWQPAGNSVVSGRARVSFTANWDRDDMDLTYELRRSGTSAPVATLKAPSTWWNQPSMTLEDTTATPGTQYSYTVVARDGDGNTATSAPVTVTAAAGVASDYVTAVLDDSPQLYYPLGDDRQDWAGSNPPVFGGAVDAGQPGIDNSSTGYSSLDGTTAGRVVSSAKATASTAFSTELWVRTTSTRGGKLIGYGDATSGSSSSYDRHVYMRNDGRIVFGVYPGSTQTVQSSASYNDGQWHHVVASQGADGISLYVDGTIVDSNTSVTTAQAYQGYWRIGGDNLSGWPNAPASNYFNGDLDEVAVYGYALNANQVNTHFGIGNGLEAPTAAFDATASELGVSLDAGASTAASGATIVQYTWDFGDGTAAGSGETATHSYAATGSYDVSLTVLDSNGLSATTTQQIAVTGPNAAPIAVAATSTSGLTVTADGTGSSDSDGEVTAYAWDWGDGEISAGALASHAYAAAGDYTVTLTITDDRNGTAEVTKQISVEHADPTAQFDVGSNGLAVDVDASTSSASDGATLAYTWVWGDGAATSDGKTSSHTYADDGTYEVTLSVTDSLGSTHSTTQSISVTQQVFRGSDTFERTVSTGWGAADVGGAWTTTGGNSAPVSVADGAGRLALSPGAGRNLVLGGASLSESGSAMTYSLGAGPSTGSLYVGLLSRYDSGSAYRSLVWHQANGTMWLLIQRDGAVIASVPVSGQSWAAGDSFHLRTEVVGESSPTIRVKMWPDGSAEPSGWQLETTDSSASALTAPGSSAVYSYRSGSATGQNVISVDDYRLQDRGEGGVPPENIAPTASFTSTPSGLALAVDGSASTDGDGTIEAFDWDFGDGTTESGKTADHQYDGAGTYTVTLTVTDDDGAAHTETRSVTMTEEVLAGSDAFEREVSTGWGAADVGGAWTTTGGTSTPVSVADGVGRLALSPGMGRNVVLGGTSLSESGSAMTYSLSGGPSTGSLYVGLLSRYDSGSSYRSLVWHQANGTMRLLIQRDGAVIANLPLAGQQWAAGDSFHLRTEVVGESSPTIRVKVWEDGLAEPSGWQLETTDASASALSAPGSSAVYSYRSGSATGQNVINVDDYRLQDGGGQAPAARMAAIAPSPELAPETEPVIEDDVVPETEQPSTTEAVPEEDSLSAPDPESDAGPETDPAADPSAEDESGTKQDAGSDTDPAADPATGTDPAADSETEAAPETEADPAGESGSEDAGDEPEVDETVDATEAGGTSEADQGAEEETAAEDSADGTDGTDTEDATPADDAADVTDADNSPATVDADSAEDSAMPTGTPVVQDDFDRSSDTGWGDAERGGTWSLADALEPATRVFDGEGALDLPAGESGDALLDGTSLSQSTVDLSFHVDAAAGAVDGQVGVVARATEDSQYSVRAAFLPDGTAQLIVQSGEKVVATQKLDGMSFSPGASYTLRVSVTGSSPTTISAKLWEIGTEEPENWQLTTTDDTSSLQGEGAVGLMAEDVGGADQLSVRFEEFVVVSGD